MIKQKIKTSLFSLFIIGTLSIHAAEKTAPTHLSKINDQHLDHPVFEHNVNYFTYFNGVHIKNFKFFLFQWVKTVKKTIFKAFTQENYKLTTDLIKKIMWENRYAITAGTCMGSYSGILLLLLSDYHYINNNKRWCFWKSDSTFEDLCAIPQKILAQELVITIGECYYNKKNPTDLGQPLLTFITTINTEIKTLKRYLSTAKALRTLHLTKIFPINNDKINAAQRQLERTLFIKHIFLSWLSEYNVSKRSRRRPAYENILINFFHTHRACGDTSTIYSAPNNNWRSNKHNLFCA